MKIIFSILFLIFFQSKVLSLEDKNSPITIKSHALQINYGQNVAKYLGEVFVKQNRLTIKCDTMTIYYGGDKTDSVDTFNANSIKKIEFDNNVVVSKDGKVAKGNTGVFNPEVHKIVLSGNASLRDGKSYLKGETVVYDTVKKLFKVNNNKPNKPTEQGRVKVFISEDQING